MNWIDVKDSLPELIEGKQHSQKVLCIYTVEYSNKATVSFIEIFTLLAIGNYTKWIKVSNALEPVKPRDIADGYTENVTHWMLIPAHD